MSINLIVAHGTNREIGLDNKLLWRLPEDLTRFKKLTFGHTVVMGRKTFESIGKVLPDRDNIILSRKPVWTFPKGVKVVKNIDSILRMSKDKEIFIIGGMEVYRAFLPYADGLYITKVDGTFKADTYFPEYKHLLEKYELLGEEEHILDSKNAYTTNFQIYKKNIAI